MARDKWSIPLLFKALQALDLFDDKDTRFTMGDSFGCFARYRGKNKAFHSGDAHLFGRVGGEHDLRRSVGSDNRNPIQRGYRRANICA